MAIGILSAIGAGVNAAKSLYGMGQLLFNDRPDRPTYNIPPAAQRYLAQRNLMAQRGLPGEDAIRSDIGASVAGAVGDVNRAATSSSAALGAITGLNQRKQEAIRDLGVRSAQYQAQQQDRAAEAQRYMADYQEKEWEYNQNLPYQRRMNEFMSNKQAGTANLFGGIEGIGSSVMQGIGAQAQSDRIQSLIDAIKGTGQAPIAGGGGAGQVNAPNTLGYPNFAAYRNTLNR